MRKLYSFLLLALISISTLAISPKYVQAQLNDWTIMVYMGGDSSLEEFGIDDFGEMASVGSATNVSVLVQFDRRPGGSSAYGDWTTAKRFLVQKGMTPDPGSAIADLGEVNMGDPNVLVDFVNWGIMNYPAHRYFLVLWGHGLGWQGVVQDSTSLSDYLELKELSWAFEAIVANNSGRKIDLLGADACRMTTEMNYQLKDFVQFFVGSQKDEPEPGWPYDLILSDLTSKPYVGPAELGKIITDRYVESYVNETGLAVALSVVDASRLVALGEEIRRFSEVGRSALPMFRDEFMQARADAESYEGNAVYDLYDIYHKLEEEFGEGPIPMRLGNAIHSVKEAVLSAVLYERNWDNPLASKRTTYAHGMSIWYPMVISDATYHELDLSKATGWDDFLLDFIDVTSGGVPDPEVELQLRALSLGDKDMDLLPDTYLATVESPVDGILEIDAHYYFQADGLDTFVIHLLKNQPKEVEISLPENVFVDLDFYLLNESGVWLNNSIRRNVLRKDYVISGIVLDGEGKPIIGANVVVENMVSGESVEVETTTSGFTASIPPSHFNGTNMSEMISVSVRYGSQVAFITFDMEYPPEEKSLSFVLVSDREEPGPFESLLLIPLAIAILLGAASIVVLLIMLRRRRRRPGGKTGDDLLRELKLD